MMKKIKLDVKQKTVDLFSEILKEMAPPPKLSIDQWADRYRILSSKSSSEPGKWSTDRAPYQRGIMQAISDKKTEMVVLKMGSQVGKTEIALNTLGYYIDYDPAPIMYLMPTKELAQEFASTRFMDMVRTVPRLKNKILDGEEGRDTKKIKEFTGGYVVFTGSGSPSELASRPIRIILVDEIDRFEKGAGTEGDPFELAKQRTKNFEGSKKIVVVSTPTVKGESKIDDLFNQGTKESFYVPCPCCGSYQKFEWRNFDFETNGIKCTDCGEISDEISWKKNRIHGEWLVENTELVDENGNVNSKIRSFHLNEFYSSWTRWEGMKEMFLRSKGDLESMKVFTNTVLAETFEEKQEVLEWEKIMNRSEFYYCEVPENVNVLTCGVDVQDNRLEYEIVGWGPDEECYGIKYGVIFGNPAEDFVWNELDDILDKEYSYSNGEKIKILCACIDSGHMTDTVYAFVKTREFRRIFAIKGVAGEREIVSKPSRNNKGRIALFSVGVDSGKDTIFSRLQIEKVGAKYCHFPLDEGTGYDETYFKGLTSEKRVNVIKKGVKKSEYKLISGRRNEPLDLRNYNLAALKIANPNLNKKYTVNATKPVKVVKKRKILSKGI